MREHATIAAEVETLRVELCSLVRRELDVRGIGPDELAPLLNLLPVGGEVMMSRWSQWTLDEIFSVATAAGIDVVVQVKKRSTF